MLVLKFGGTSVGSPEAIKRLIDIVTNEEHRLKVRVVVVSAFSGVTDALIQLAVMAEAGSPLYREKITALSQRHYQAAAELCDTENLLLAKAFLSESFERLTHILDGVNALRELSLQTLDTVMSFGECFSAFIIAAAFRSNKVEADYLDARTVLRADNSFGAAHFDSASSYTNIRSAFYEGSVLRIVTGFIAATVDGKTVTLGRGGSDLSGAIFASALGAEALEIWTDVDGILSADPKIVKNAFTLKAISYEEAMELSHFGAKVLHPPTVRPALEANIPIRIRNSFNPNGSGTLIVLNAPDSPYPVRGVASIKDVALIRVQGSGMVGVAGFSSRLFGALAAKGVNIILISQASSEYSICCAILPKDAQAAILSIKNEFNKEIASGAIDEPKAERDLSIVAAVGANMKNTSGIAGKVFHALGRNGVNVVAIAQGSSELNISAVISKPDESKAVNAIHEAFFLSGQRSVNLFLIGIGLIGGTLLDQLAAQQEILSDQHKVRINLVGIANSRRMALDAAGINPHTARDRLSTGEPFNMTGFLDKMKRFNLPNSVFCDCTASELVSGLYLDVLTAAIPVITPNKRANSGTYDSYKALIAYARERGIPYLYETTVCAGLPVISVLHDLVLSGDRVRKIEAVLSGSLSYIFNNFDGTKPFSALVREAKTLGYTEPDPRDDLAAVDAARKALILAREAGLALELADIRIESLLPASCFEQADPEVFYKAITAHDQAFARRVKAAKAKGAVLRYVATIEEGKAELALRELGPDSPFRHLVDADNIVVIRSDRYSVLPLVVKGPGAGAQVTAGGVFADIVRIARTLV